MENVTQNNKDSFINQAPESPIPFTKPLASQVGSPTLPVISKKSRMVKIALLILIGMSTAFGGMYGWNQMVKKPTSNMSSALIQPTVTPSPQAITIPPITPTPITPQVKVGTLTSITSTQNVYKNEKYEFEMNLPKNFYITQEGGWGNEDDSSAAFYVDLSTIKPEDVPGRQFPGIRIVVRNFSGDLLTYVKEMDVTGFYEYDPINPHEIIETVVGGKSAYQLFNSYFVANNGKIYSINNGIDDNLFDQIITSFKFIN